jgi:hypothetical protein
MAPLVLIVAAMLAIFALEARFFPPKPGPHYAAGYPPGTICDTYGRWNLRFCERDPDYKPPKPPGH